jgi:hypothetical protein
MLKKSNVVMVPVGRKVKRRSAANLPRRNHYRNARWMPLYKGRALLQSFLIGA